MSRTVARVKLLAAIKGTPPDEFDIAYPFPIAGGMAAYPMLNKDAVILVFLAGKVSSYAFTDLDNDHMVTGATTIVFTPEKSPEERLQAEIAAAVNTLHGADQLLAIEQLGKVGGAEAATTLRPLSMSADIPVAGEAIIARISAKDPPDVAMLLAFLKRKPVDFDDAASSARYRTNRYCVQTQQVLLLKAVEESISIQADYSRPGAIFDKLPDFPYLDFVRQVLRLDIVKKGGYPCFAVGTILRRLADPTSTPLLITLIDYPNADLRYFAVTTLAKIYDRSYLIPSTGVFEKNEEKYRSYWREWWKAHRGEFEEKK